LETIVHPAGLRSVVGDHCRNPVTGVSQYSYDIGEVVLALCVLGCDPAQSRTEQTRPEAIDGRVDLGDRQFGVGSIAMLDHADDPILPSPHDPAVAARVSHVRSEQCARRIGLTVHAHELSDRGSPQKRRITRQHEQIGLRIIELVGGERRERNSDRVAGAALHGLFDKLERDVGRCIEELRCHSFGSVADDDDSTIDVAVVECIEHVEHHRTTAQQMKRFRT